MFDLQRRRRGRRPETWRWIVPCIVGVLGTGMARADSVDVDPDLEIAHRRFERGRAAYEANDYAAALQEFEAVRVVKPSPALDWNIGRCLDRLERFAEAVAAYERYLAATPNEPDAPEVRARVATLKQRLANLPAKPSAPAPAPVAPPAAAPSPAAAAPSSPSPGLGTEVFIVGRIVSAPGAPAPRPGAASPADAGSAAVVPPAPRPAGGSWTAPIAVGGASLALAITGTLLVATVAPDYDRLLAKWNAEPSAELRAQAEPLKARAWSGYALLGVAGAAAAIDVALWVIAARQRRVERRAWLAPTWNSVGGGFAVGGSF